MPVRNQLPIVIVFAPSVWSARFAGDSAGKS